ncbi:MAG: butyryl-CoA:acetate CoA-transferase [Firmicutes bacterium]|nr:butyryl-CoA:acetate CoA-transferase [Bacillota bacterium]
MSYAEEYKRKLVSADEAVKVIKSGDWVEYGEFAGTVRALDKALAKRKDELSDIKIWATVTPYPLDIIACDPQGDVFTYNSWHMSGYDRKMANSGFPVYYSSIKYSEVPRYIRQEITGLDVAMMQVTPMDKHGYFNFGPQCSFQKANSERAKIVIVEVNEKQPRCLGGYEESIHISEVDYIVEGENPPLAQIPAPPPSDVDKRVAEIIVGEMSDGCCVQLGIGGMPNAVGMMIADSDLKDLGCHTEMLVDAYVYMHEAGKMTGARKGIDPYKMVYTFALGTQILYDFIDNNPKCATYPVNYTNKPAIAALNDKLITINNAVEVDIYGQCSSESDGFRQISGTGGQLDFVIAGFESKGGKSIVCLPSTYRAKDGALRSRIVPSLRPGSIVTDPRSVAHYIVTEYGKFSLKGKSSWERAEGLIGIAHPDLRDELIGAAEAQSIWRRTNKLA